MFCEVVRETFVNAQPTTSTSKVARDALSFMMKLCTHAGSLHYILNSKDRVAPIKPRYKRVFDISLVFKYLEGLGSIIDVMRDPSLARRRFMMLLLCDSLGRSELLSKCHYNTLEFQRDPVTNTLSALYVSPPSVLKHGDLGVIVMAHLLS